MILLTSQLSWGEHPQVLIKGYDLELVAQDPDIVTPVSIAFDSKGRLLVIENHTHQRPGDYVGPKTDRIRRMEFKNGKLVGNSVFFEGTKDTMSVRVFRDDSIFVATRREIFRLDDHDDDGDIDSRTSIVKLETDGDYPHNGLSGLAFHFSGDQAPWLYFGLGENLGERYAVVGSDGQKISGGGEGGSIYRCKPKGTQLERVATGFWNPFGNCFDPHGRLFSVDNDPDASPPCRLNYVVPTGDYGYQFRYGRSGRHPLQTWNGDLPGTLGMAAGTGEAPCEIVAHDGRLWVTSWGDHRIERYRIVPHGAGCAAERELVVTGSKDFRPVGLAVWKTGEIYFSDWVDRSYPVHGKGRIWKLTPTKDLAPAGEFPVLSSGERLARDSRGRGKKEFHLLDREDPFLRQTGVWNVFQAIQEDRIHWSDMKSANQRVGFLQGARWADPMACHPFIASALDDKDVNVRLMALRIIADDGLREHKERVLKMITHAASDPQLLSVAVSVALWLDDGGETKDRKVVDQYLSDLVFNPANSKRARLAAIGLLPVDHAAFRNGRLENLIHSKDDDLASAVIHVLSLRGNPEDQRALISIAEDKQRSSQLRADAVAGLTASTQAIELCMDLLNQTDAVVSLEAKRNLAHFQSTPIDQTRPAASRIDQWLNLIDKQNADPKAGRRVFFRSSGSQCAKCHRFQGRGSSVGPDLTKAHRRGFKRWLLESILQPSKEMSPRFMPVAVIKKDGSTFSGLELQGPGEKGFERYLLANGTEIDVESTHIESRRHLSISIMPSGFDKQLTVAEVADLVAFLGQKRLRP